MLHTFQVPFEFAVKQVLEQLRAIATGETPAIEKRKLGTIVFAAVSLPVTEIQSLLDNVSLFSPLFTSLSALPVTMCPSVYTCVS